MSDIVGHRLTFRMKSKELKSAKITIRLEDVVRETLEKMAEAEDRSLSDFIRSELKKIAAKGNDIPKK